MARSDRILIAAGGGALALAVAAAFVLLAPTGGGEAGVDDAAGLLAISSAPGPSTAIADAGTIVVDVEGAVAGPGVRELPAGSRVADAIAAAGGYATDADLAAAADLNLAQPLVDGQQVRVPRIGDAAVAAAPSAGPAGGGSAAGLVNVNTATPEELEALPGIGAVTVQKIVAARQERPFSSLQDMVDRGVIHNGQLEDITDLATAA
ncbi:MAG TPA: helix-hairpin-helix domain-containing protein [Candidatus Limnocylindria bacterium]